MNTSPFGTLFTAIQDRIKLQVPEIRFIEQDLGQLEFERPPVVYPCALIDFTDWTFEDAGENLQFAQGSINIRLAFEAFSTTHNITPDTFKNKALHYYDLEWKLYKSLQGWKPEKYGYLLRTAAATEPREDNLRVRVLQFSCGFEDLSAMSKYQKVNLKPLHIDTTIQDADTFS